MIRITFPDKSVKEYEAGVNGLDIAKSISGQLAREILSITVNGELWDINRPIHDDAVIVLHKWEDPEGKTRAKVHIVAEHVELKPKFKRDDEEPAEGKNEASLSGDNEDPDDSIDFPEQAMEAAS